MKNLLIALLIVPVYVFGQGNTTRQSSVNTSVIYNGGLGSDKRLVIPVYSDTTAANGYYSTYPSFTKNGNIIKTSAGFWVNNGTTWLNLPDRGSVSAMVSSQTLQGVLSSPGGSVLTMPNVVNAGTNTFVVENASNLGLGANDTLTLTAPVIYLNGYVIGLPDCNIYLWDSELQNAAFGPYGRDGHGMFQIDTFIYTVGGWNPDAIPSQRTDSVVLMSSPNNLTSWTLSYAPWQGRHSFGHGVKNDTAFIWGGDMQKGALPGAPYDTVYQKDVWRAVANSSGVLTWTQIASNVPWGSRVLFGHCVHNNALYVLGGQVSGDHNQGVFTDVWRSYDGITWTQIATNISFLGRNLDGAVISYDGYIYIIGGGIYASTIASSTYERKIYRSLDGVTWEQLSDFPGYGRQYPSLTTFQGKIFYGFGGGTIPNGGTVIHQFNDLWSFDGSTWQQIFYPREIPGRHASAVIGLDSVIVLTAGSEKQATVNDVWTIFPTQNLAYVFQHDTLNNRQTNTDSLSVRRKFVLQNTLSGSTNDTLLVLDRDTVKHLPIPTLTSYVLSGLAAVATSGSYTDLSNKPIVATDGSVPMVSSGTLVSSGISASGSRVDIDKVLYLGVNKIVILGANASVNPYIAADGSDLYFGTLDAWNMLMKANGDFLIGQASPEGDKLQVNGTVSGSDVKIKFPSAGSNTDLKVVRDPSTGLLRTYGEVETQNSFTASGDGVSTSITITLPKSATWVMVGAKNEDAGQIDWWEVSGTTLTIHYSIAPVLGTSNLQYWIEYK